MTATTLMIMEMNMMIYLLFPHLILQIMVRSWENLPLFYDLSLIKINIPLLLQQIHSDNDSLHRTFVLN